MGLLVKRRVTLDLARRGTQATVPFSLGDRCAYEVIFTLRDGSEQVALPPGTSAAVTVRNGAGGTGCVDGCVIDHVNNNVIYTPTVDALSVEGNIECTLHLFDGDGGVIGAPTFIFAVSEGDKADTEGEVSKALVANPGWGIIADTENKAKEAAAAAAAANNFASQASDEVAAAQMAAAEARAEADRARTEAELSKMWAHGGALEDQPPSEINNSYYWAMMSATERISAETQVGLAAAEVNKAKTEVQNAAAEVEKAKTEVQTAEAEAIKARMWAVGEKSTPGKTSPSDSNNAMYYSNKSRDYMNEAEKYTNMTLSLSVDREKHIYTVSLIRDGTVIGNPIEIDLPFEEVVVGGEYDDTTKALVLKLKDGGSVSIPVGDIISPDDVVRRQYPGSYDAVYTETSSGEVVLLPVKVYSGDGAANTLVKRGSLGEIRVRSNPEFDDEAVPKRHVDEVADALGKGLEDLKKWVTQNQPDPVEIVQNLGYSPTAVIAQKGVTEAIDGLALKGSASGKVIRVDDVASGEYPVKVTVRGKNLFDLSKISVTDTTANVSISEVGEDYLVITTASGYESGGYKTTNKKLSEICPELELGKTYTLSASSDNAVNDYIYIGETWRFGAAKTITQSMLDYPVVLYGLNAVNGEGTGNCRIANIQIELGDIATDYEPYVDPSSVKVTRYGATTSDSSQTYTPNADGTVDGVLSLYPVMTLVTDNTAAILDVEYNRDLNVVADGLDATRTDVEVDVEPYVIKNFWISYGSTTGQSVTWANTIEVPCKAGEIYKLNMNGTQIYDGNPCFIRNAEKKGMLLIMNNYASVPEGDRVFIIPEGGASIVITFSSTKTPIPSLRRCELSSKGTVLEKAKEVCAELMLGASNALTGTAVGSAVKVTDVSPNKHKIKIKATYPDGVDPTAIVATACGKNLIPFPYPRLSGSTTKSGITATVQEDGGICFNGTSAEVTQWGLCSIGFAAYDILCTANGHFISNAEYSTADLKAGKTPRWKVAYDKNSKSTFVEVQAGTYENMVAYPQLEVGRVSTEYARGDGNIVLAFDENGEAEVDSIHPDMTVYSIQDGVSFTLDYTKDINIALAKTQYKGYGLPTLYFYGDTDKMTKDAKATLNYRYGDRSGTCTMKWQGSSSIAYEKKNYTVTFDTEFEAVEGWGEQKKYCLKANFIDHSHLRNVCSAKLWGSIVRLRSYIHPTLAASPNYGAVDGFPVCVVINDVYAGLYTFSVPKDGWMMGMGDGSQEAIVSAESGTYAACRFKGTSNILTAFDVEYATDEDDTAWIETSLNRLIQACIDSDGTDLDTTIAQYLDWESAIDYLIFSLALDNHDGIFRNYLLSTYDGVKWFFTAYDLDSTFGNLASGTGIRRVTESTVNTFKSNHRLFELILTYKLNAVKARLSELTNVTRPLEADEIAYRFANYSAKIPKALLDEDCEIWKTIPGTTYNNLGQIIDWYRSRFKYLKEWFG